MICGQARLYAVMLLVKSAMLMRVSIIAQLKYNASDYV